MNAIISDFDKAIECIRKLAPWRADDRKAWLAVGMAAHSVSQSQTMLAEWEKFSQQSEKYKPGECARQWRSFKADGGVGIGSLIEWSKTDGGNAGRFTPPPSRPPMAPPPAKPPTANKPGFSTLEAAVEVARSSIARDKKLEIDQVKHVRCDRYSDSFVVCRFDLPTMKDGKREKSFRPFHVNGNGWKIGDPEGTLPLFNLKTIKAAPPGSMVYLTEGEKASEAAGSIGLLATTSAHGAQSAKRTDWTPLAGHDVVILPDADEEGEVYVNVASAEIIKAGAKSVRVLRLPGLPPKGDIVDWLDAHECVEPDSLRADIEVMAAAADIVTAKDEQDDDDDSLIARCAADVNTRPVSWFWRNKFVAGAINLLIGMPDVGKSVVTCDIAARKTTGDPWPPVDGERAENSVGSVVFFAAEDSPETTLVPRLRAAGADLSKVHFVEGVNRDTSEGKIRDQFDIQRDVMHLRKMHRRIPDLRLVIIDPLDSYISAKTDTNVGNQARAALWPLKDWAEVTGITVIIVHHFNKSATTNAMDKVSGARSFGALPRSVWAVGRDPDDDKRTIMAPIKLNLVKQDQKKAIAYEIKSSLHDSDQPCVHWKDEAISLTAGDIVAGKQTQKCKAAEWLREMLANGPMPAKELQEHAEDAGHSWRTVEKAKDEAKAISEQVYENGKITGWQWRLK